MQSLADERRALRNEVESLRQLHAPNYPRKVPRSGRTPATAPSPIASISAGTDLSAGSHEYIFKHMGRMVRDETGSGRWSGSTTGVHFISSVENLCKNASESEGFPEHCFRLHLLQPLRNGVIAADPGTPGVPYVHALRALFNLPLQYYLNQIELFNTTWAAFCPVLMPREMERALTTALADLHSMDEISKRHIPTFLVICVVLSLNCAQDIDSLEHDLLIEALCSDLGWKTDISALQALALFALWLQVQGQSIRLSQLTGRLVSVVQALGMHRHAQRFDLKEAEIEFRKRLWWFIYSLDKYVNIW